MGGWWGLGRRAAPVVLGLVMGAGCAPAATPAPATPVQSLATAAPHEAAPTAPVTAPPAAALTAPPASVPVRLCTPDAASSVNLYGPDPSAWPTPAPGTAEAVAGRLDLGVVPPGAAVYVGLIPAGPEAGSEAWSFATVAPSGLDCTALAGNYRSIWVTDGSGANRVEVWFPGSAGPNEYDACPYVAAAREWASGGGDASQCRQPTAARVASISTGVTGLYLAAVSRDGPEPAGFGGFLAKVPYPNVTLFAYVRGDVPRTTMVACSLATTDAPSCYAALAHFVAQQFGAQLTDPARLDAALAAVVGVPARPGP